MCVREKEEACWDHSAVSLVQVPAMQELSTHPFDDTDQSFLENFITLATSSTISAYDSTGTLFFSILCVSSSCAYTLNANILQRYPRPTAQLIHTLPTGLLQTLTCCLFFLPRDSNTPTQ